MRAYDDLEVPAFEVRDERENPNAWGLPDDFELRLHGDAAQARSPTCGGQATISMIIAAFQVIKVPYAEIVAMTNLTWPAPAQASTVAPAKSS